MHIGHNVTFLTSACSSRQKISPKILNSQKKKFRLRKYIRNYGLKLCNFLILEFNEKSEVSRPELHEPEDVLIIYGDEIMKIMKTIVSKSDNTVNWHNLHSKSFLFST